MHDADQSEVMLRVLIPLDGTEDSYRVIDGVAALMGADRVEVDLLVSRPDKFAGAPEDVLELLEEEVSHGIIATTEHLHDVEAEGMRRCAAVGIEPKILERSHRPMQEILEESSKHDVLAMHALDRNRFLADLHGSQGGKIARRSNCSVLLIDPAKLPNQVS